MSKFARFCEFFFLSITKIYMQRNRLYNLKGLILCGGESRRMGFDKSTLKYRGLNLVEKMIMELKGSGVDPFISCRDDQKHLDKIPVAKIVDSSPFKGPAAGLYCAMKAYPDSIWLCVPCDMPLLNSGILNYLLMSRNADKPATVFETEEVSGPFVHPLPGLYEKSFNGILELELNKGNWSLRKMHQLYDSHLLRPVQPDLLVNLNKPEDLNRI